MTGAEDVRAKLEDIGRLRRDGGSLRDYHAPRWDEPLIMEQSVPGERGFMVSPPEPAEIAEVGDPLALIPEGSRRESLPDLPELSQYHVMRHYLRLSQSSSRRDSRSVSVIWRIE